MRIIISPAKKMNVDTDSFLCSGLPMFIERTRTLKAVLCSMSREELKKLWRCSDRIADTNIVRLGTMDLDKSLTPALFSYEGIQYQYMAPGVFTDTELDYIKKRLIILSGFYRMLRPFDGVVPYRLEMQAKMSGEGFKSLYEFWKGDIAGQIFSETDIVVNLASKEYSRVVSDYVPDGAMFINCVFGELIDGRIIEKGTLCKMARGEMVRFMAENKIENARELAGFDRLKYAFSPEYSDERNYVFIKQ